MRGARRYGYSTPTSTEGRQARHFIESKRVAYEDLDVSADQQALTGRTDWPVIVVGDRVFVGFHPSELEGMVPSLF